MTPILATQASEAIDRLYVVIDHAESALAGLKPLIRRVAESDEVDGYVPPDAVHDARRAALDLVEAAQAAGKHLRTLEQIAGGEPCS